MFMVTGPGSPSVLSNMVVSIEQHVDWITDCIAAMRAARSRRGSRRPTRPSSEWVQHVSEVAERDALPARDVVVRRGEHPGQAARVHAVRRRVRTYRQECDEVAGDGYRGFRLRSESEPAADAQSAVA